MVHLQFRMWFIYWFMKDGVLLFVTGTDPERFWYIGLSSEYWNIGNALMKQCPTGRPKVREMVTWTGYQQFCFGFQIPLSIWGSTGGPCIWGRSLLGPAPWYPKSAFKEMGFECLCCDQLPSQDKKSATGIWDYILLIFSFILFSNCLRRTVETKKPHAMFFPTLPTTNDKVSLEHPNDFWQITSILVEKLFEFLRSS